MNTDLLNRIGIILNCLAGLMMTPDIIGRERLKFWDRLLETKLRKTLSFMKTIYTKNKFVELFPLGTSPFTPKIIATFALIACVLSFVSWRLIISWYIQMSLIDLCIQIIFIAVIIPLIIVFPTVISLVLYHYSKKKSFWVQLLPAFFLFCLYVCITILWGIPICFFLVFGYLIPLILKTLLTYIIDNMKGTDRFVSVFVKMGVLFFIGGNLLLLLATFVSDK
jgi:hypothetical protein